jgi:hypothetical protein
MSAFQLTKIGDEYVLAEPGECPEHGVYLSRNDIAGLAAALQSDSFPASGYARNGLTASIDDGALYIEQGGSGGDRFAVDADHIPALVEALRGVL